MTKDQPPAALLSFSLLDEPWLPVTTQHGDTRHVSLKDVFAHAHRLQGIEDDSLLVVAALYRLLLAVLHRATRLRSLEDWYTVWQAGSFAGQRLENIHSYLERYRDRFDLFSREKPFFQTAGFAAENGEPSPAADLFTELSRPFFAHPPESGDPTFAPDEVARALIATQLTALPGGKGFVSVPFGQLPYRAKGPLAGAAVVLILGENLFETLLLNTCADEYLEEIKSTEADCPIWERDQLPHPPFGERTPDGYLDYLTWMSRHIRLLPEMENGRLRVRRMYFGQAYALPPNSLLQSNSLLRDPMCAYVTSQGANAKKTASQPLGLSAEKALWRDAGSLFAFSRKKDDQRPLTFRQAAVLAQDEYLPKGKTLRCAVFGLANDQAKPLLWRQETLPLPLELLSDEELVGKVQHAVQHAEAVGEALDTATKALARRLLDGGDPQRKVDGRRVAALAKSLGALRDYWAALDLPFRRFFSALSSQDAETLLTEWKTEVVATARRAFDRAADNCLNRTMRELRARVMAEQKLERALARHQPTTAESPSPAQSSVMA